MTGDNNHANHTECAPDALSIIGSDLDASQAAKRRHYAPALLLVILACAGFLVVGGLRPDLLERPAWELGLQLVSWSLCLLLFPAIGLGLIFPSRTLRVTVAIAAVMMTFATTVGFEVSAGPHGHYHFAGGCAGVVLGTGGAFLALGVLSGAFFQRRSAAGAYWIAGGVTLTALNIITWHCPVSGVGHVLTGHLGGAGLLMVVACAVGVIAHRLRRRDAAAAKPGSESSDQF